jgi:17beta-estradiol 17-dehydrogenase / very-long-chain 3-oxoacyl-CoA reductase
MLNVEVILQLVGLITVVVLFLKIGWAVYFKLIVPPKKPLQYGKWAIITGSTSGIGEDFAEYLAGEGMNLLLISRSSPKLEKQKAVLENKFKIKVSFLAYDFTDMGPNRKTFYSDLDAECIKMTADGGVGLLINNVGTVHYYPKRLIESTDEDIDSMLNCNINSVVYMSRTVLKYMMERRNGGIVSISSGSCFSPNPYISVYSATK